MVGCADQVEALQHGCADNATLDGVLRNPLTPPDTVSDTAAAAAADTTQQRPELLDFDYDGEPLATAGGGGQKWPLCDKTIGDDALDRLAAASASLNATGTPFFLNVGFRKVSAWLSSGGCLSADHHPLRHQPRRRSTAACLPASHCGLVF